MKIRTNNKAGQSAAPKGPYPAQYPYVSPDSLPIGGAPDGRDYDWRGVGARRNI